MGLSYAITCITCVYWLTALAAASSTGSVTEIAQTDILCANSKQRKYSQQILFAHTADTQAAWHCECDLKPLREFILSVAQWTQRNLWNYSILYEWINAKWYAYFLPGRSTRRGVASGVICNVALLFSNCIRRKKTYLIKISYQYSNCICAVRMNECHSIYLTPYVIRETRVYLPNSFCRMKCTTIIHCVTTSNTCPEVDTCSSS